MNPRHSLIIPVYKNEMNMDDLLAALEKLNGEIASLEVVFVVDGSPDKSWEILRDKLPAVSFCSRLVLLSRNFGSFAAIRTGMEYARGEFVAVMAADLQEPPELVKAFFSKLAEGGSDIVMGQRTRRDDPPLSRFLSSTYWKLYRKYVVKGVPRGGVDIFGCTRQVADAMLRMNESNTSLVAQLFWVGYRRDFIPYERRVREKGKSAWTFTKKIKYFLDSVFAFSDLPLLLLLWLGALGVVFSFLVMTVTLVAKVAGLIDVPGYTALLLVILFTFSIVILSQGIMGCYLWRCFENTKHRPLTLVQHEETFQGTGGVTGETLGEPHGESGRVKGA